MYRLSFRVFVALRKESVDRNIFTLLLVLISLVALRKESVDRNPPVDTSSVKESESLSARRAWIEMQVFQRIAKPFRVALRKESVDRNLWWGVRKAVGSLVALRKESVDRNRYYCDDFAD